MYQGTDTVIFNFIKNLKNLYICTKNVKKDY